MDQDGHQPRIREVSQANFESEVLKAHLPVVAAFCAPWSRPCKVIDSIIEEVAIACAGRATVVRVNADDNPDLSLWYDIESIPTLLCFVQGTPRTRLVGTASKEAILSKLEDALHGGPSTHFKPDSDNANEQRHA